MLCWGFVEQNWFMWIWFCMCYFMPQIVVNVENRKVGLFKNKKKIRESSIHVREIPQSSLAEVQGYPLPCAGGA